MVVGNHHNVPYIPPVSKQLSLKDYNKKNVTHEHMEGIFKFSQFMTYKLILIGKTIALKGLDCKRFFYNNVSVFKIFLHPDIQKTQVLGDIIIFILILEGI